MPFRPVLTIITVSIMLSVALAPAGGSPIVIITSPADGTILQERTVRINGTAAGSDAYWDQTTQADFDSGTKENLVSDSDGSLSLDRAVFDDFNDGRVDATKWSSKPTSGITITEESGVLRFYGANQAPAGQCNGGITGLSQITNPVTISADLKSFHATGTQLNSCLGIGQDDTHGAYIGITREPRFGSGDKVLLGSINGGPGREDVAYADYDGLSHNLKMTMSGNSVRYYMDDVLLSSHTVAMSTMSFGLSYFLRDTGNTIDAWWDDIKSFLAKSGNFTSAEYDIGCPATVLKRAEWNADVPSGTWISVKVRSSDSADMSSPTPWTVVPNGQTAGLPLKRYLQYRVVFSSNTGLSTPVLNDIALVYSRPLAKVEVSIDGQATWEAVEGTSEWSARLALPEGNTTIWVKGTDDIGEIALTSITVGVDTTPPKGSVLINRGAGFTGQRLVLVTLNATDLYGIDSMVVSEDPEFADASWTGYSSPISFTLSGGDGPKTVYARFRDTNGLVSNRVNDSIVLDTTPPKGSMVINHDAEFTMITDVNLTLYASDLSGVSEMMVSNRSDLKDSLWMPFMPEFNWSVPPGNGERNLYVMLRDPSKHESAVCHDSIILDTMAPAVNVVINSGAAHTTSPDVTLALNATDNYRVEKMQVSQEKLFFGSGRESYRTSRDLRLDAGDGMKTIYARVFDAAGNAGEANLSSIILDTTPPVSSLGQLPIETDDVSIAVAWSGSDATSGIKWFDLQYRDRYGPWTNWLQHTVLGTSRFTGEEGHNYSFRVRAQDIAGNLQAYPEESGAGVYVRPQYAPVVIIKSPRDGAKLAGTVSIKGTAIQPDDRRNIVRVQVRVDDGNWAAADGTVDWNFRLDTTLLAEGAHILEVQAFDGERYSIEAKRNFTVANAGPGVAVPLPLVVAILVVIAAAATGGVYMRSRKER